MPGYLIGILVVLGLIVWYVIHCAWWPFGGCWRCGGTGKFQSSSGRSWRRCRRCKGSGERVRIGRRVFDAIRRSRDGDRGR